MALSEVSTVLATVWPKMLVITTFLPAAPATCTEPLPEITVTEDTDTSSLAVASSVVVSK